MPIEETLQEESRVNRFANGFQKVMPSSLTVAIILLLVVALLAKIFAHAPVFVSTEDQMSIADSMYEHYWDLLAFSMQMCIVSILGNVFAMSPPIRRGLRRLCQIPQGTLSAYILCSVIAFCLSFFHWAVGMMGAIVIGKEMLVVAHDRKISIHTPSFIACIFSVSLVGWSGIAASPVLYASTQGYLKTLVDEATASQMKDIYTIRDTVLYDKPMITLLVSAVICVAAVLLLRPKEEKDIELITDEQYEYYSLKVEIGNSEKGGTLAQRLENSIVLEYILVAMMGYATIRNLLELGLMGITLNSFNFLMFTASLACCVRPRVFTKLVVDTVNSVWGFIIQYPVYAAIFGIIVGTGLDKVVSGWFLAIATENTWPSIAMLYSGFMNIFVPSGGSKFIIEAPYIIPVSQKLNVPIETIIMSYSYGDCGTNMLTPFWWIAPCAMFKIDLHKVYPYAVVAAIATITFYFFAMFLW